MKTLVGECAGKLFGSDRPAHCAPITFVRESAGLIMTTTLGRIPPSVTLICNHPYGALSVSPLTGYAMKSRLRQTASDISRRVTVKEHKQQTVQ